jgi:hypothetical protein
MKNIVFGNIIDKSSNYSINNNESHFFFTRLISIYASKTVSLEKFEKYLPIFFEFFEK